MDEKILFVDDNPGPLEDCIRTLQKSFKIDVAATGEEGLRLFEEQGPYAVVVADMELPLKRGIELLIKVRDEAPDTVRIALTSNPNANTATEAVNRANVFRFLVKPCLEDAFVSALVAAIKEFRQTTIKTEQIALERISPREAGRWTVSLGPEILTLHHANGRPIVMLFREEAARYINFSFDPVRGTTVTFSFIPGMKGYSFLCSKEALSKLLGWLPNKSRAEIEQEIRRSGIGVGLLGVAQALVTQGASLGWAAALLIAGFLAILFPKRQTYYLNGLVMLLVGLADLTMYAPAGSQTGGVPIMEILPVLMGGLLIIWFAHQISLAGPNQQLRAARAIRDKQAEFMPSHSPLVCGVARAMRWISLVFAVYAAAVLWVALSGTRALGPVRGLTSVLPDLAIFGVLAVLLFAVSFGMALSKRLTYVEAKVAAQLVITVVVLSFWSVLLNFDFQAPASFFGHVFLPGVLVFDHPYSWGSMSFFGGWMQKELTLYARPYVWFTLVLCVLAFNVWFTRSVDKELEDLRCQSAE